MVNLYYQINFLEQTKGNLISQRQAFVDGELGEITHDYVVSPELPAVNTQYINSVYTAFLESGENEEVIITEYNSLLAIASQCPAAGGKAVYRARAMLSQINDSLEYTDDIVCLQSGIYRQIESEYELPFDFELAPNPANDKVNIKLFNAKEGICTMKLINMYGSTIYIKNIDCKVSNHELSFKNISSGIYFVEVEYNSYKKSKKLIIIK